MRMKSTIITESMQPQISLTLTANPHLGITAVDKGTTGYLMQSFKDTNSLDISSSAVLGLTLLPKKIKD